MLVLNRRSREAIVIDGRIRVVVVDVRGDTVKLGFEAPSDVNIWREELYDAMLKKANRRRNHSD